MFFHSLLVLDEIDQLDSKRQSVLYTIFEWPSLASSRMVLIGIANALDLTERTLPRLQARCSLRPDTLHFAPYTKEQIIDIFTSVLASEDKSNLFSPVALQMLAGKNDSNILDLNGRSYGAVHPRSPARRRADHLALPLLLPALSAAVYSLLY